MLKKRSHALLLLLSAFLEVIATAGCSSEVEQRSLTVSIEPQRYLLERIVGDKWKVNTLLTQGSDPENFDPPMSAMKKVVGGTAYFKMGYMAFEDVLIARTTDGGSPVRIVDTSVGIDLIEGGHVHDHGDDDCGHSHEIDPHVWSSVRNAEVIARNMFDGIVEIDPANAGFYKANYERLLSSLDSLDRQIRGILEPTSHATFLTWHPSLSYFARDYGLNQIVLGRDNKELSATGFRFRIADAREHHASAFLVQPEFDSSRSRELAEQAGARMVMINLLAYDWPDEMIRVAEAIAGKI